MDEISIMHFSITVSDNTIHYEEKHLNILGMGAINMKLLAGSLYIDTRTSFVMEMREIVHRRLTSFGESCNNCDADEDDKRVLTDEEFCSMIRGKERNDSMVFTGRSGYHESVESSLPDFDEFHCLDIWD